VPHYNAVKVFDGLEQDLNIPNAHITIGTFDGVHIGHQKIINKLNDSAQAQAGESVLFTFHPHPREVLNPGEPIPLIQTREEKLDKLKRLGLKNVILYPFSKAFSQTPADSFIKDFLIGKLKMKAVVIGYDHQFGKNREGSLEHFKKLSLEHQFSVEEIPAQDIDDIHVSSTKIRTALQEGDIQTANKYLGEPFQLNGTVIKGRSIGKKIGFPTANIVLDDKNKIIPKSGVYLVRCCWQSKMYFGMMNIGIRPTFDQEILAQVSIEIHIFDFQKEIYGDHLQVEILSFIRNESKFDNPEALQNQLASDEAFCRSQLSLFSVQPYTF
jgi:riboflavin kinase / FMN adenylyltransferase